MDTAQQQALAERARQGDADAWESLYRNVYPRLRAYALAHAERSLCEDLVNETMARAVAGIARFGWEGGGFDAWLFGILRRVCSEHHRSQKRHNARYKAEAMTTASQPGDELELADDHSEVRRAFGRLRADEREVLELRLVAGLSAEDVGRVLGKPAGAVRTAQSRALANLRLLMERLR